MGLEARIWAMRLGFGSQDWDLSLEPGGRGEDKRTGEKKEEEKEKIPYMCESQGRAIHIGYCIGFTIFLSIGLTQYSICLLLISQYNT